MDQSAINWALGAINLLLGAVLKALWDGVKDLQKADTVLVDRVSSVEVLVVGNYIKREEFSELTKAIFDKLERIDNKLDKKADK